MKFSVYTAKFKEAATKVTKIAIGNGTFGFEMKKNNNCGVLHIFASDDMQCVDVEVTCVNNYPCEGEGAFTLSNIKIFANALKFCESPILEFEVEDEVLQLRCGGKVMEIKILSDIPNDFPTPKIIKNEWTYSNKELKARFDKIKYALPKIEDVKIVHSGVLFDGTKMVTTDGYRIAHNTDKNTAIINPFVVSPKVLTSINSLLGDEITIKTDETHMFVQDKDTTFVGKLYTGSYPTFASDLTVYNDRCIDTLYLNAETFVKGLKYLNTFVNEKEKLPILWVGDTLSIENPNGCFKVTMSEGEMPEKMLFNPRYLLETFSQFGDCYVTVRYSSNHNPIIITGDEMDDVAVLCPIRDN